MARSNQNLTPLSNQELLSLRKGAKTVDRISVRIGGKRYNLPVEAHVLTTDDEKGLFTFISLPATNAILGVTSDGHEVIKEGEKGAAMGALRTTIARAKKANEPKGADTPALGDDVLKALKAAVPAGYRLVYENGEPKLQRLRQKRSGTEAPATTGGRRGRKK